MPKTAKAPADGTAQVDAFMAKLKHPLKADLEAVRLIIRDASTDITEEIKWNSPGFRTTESFATVSLRSTDQVQLIFHLGAKVRPDLKEMKISDPSGLIKWLAKDRSVVSVGSGAALKTNKSALQAIVRAWIKYL